MPHHPFGWHVMSGTLLKRFNDFNRWPGPVTFAAWQLLKCRWFRAVAPASGPVPARWRSCHPQKAVDSVMPVTFVESF